MTLVEVVASLALLATVLVAILLAKQRSARQSARADRRLTAIEAADHMLGNWAIQGNSPLPRTGGGPVEDHSGLAWRTHIVGRPAIPGVPAYIVRLEIFDTHSAAPPAEIKALASIDLLVADPPPPPPTTAASQPAPEGTAP